MPTSFLSVKRTPCATLDRALDALAREPGLHAEIECLSRGLCASTDGCVEYQRTIAALEARLARVRALADDWKKRVGTANRGEVLMDCGYNEAWSDCLKALDAALAADAGPEDLASQMAADPEFARRTEAGWKAIEEGRYVPLSEAQRRLWVCETHQHTRPCPACADAGPAGQEPK